LYLSAKANYEFHLENPPSLDGINFAIHQTDRQKKFNNMQYKKCLVSRSYMPIPYAKAQIALEPTRETQNISILANTLDPLPFRPLHLIIGYIYFAPENLQACYLLL
jgi:hypothetical protein